MQPSHLPKNQSHQRQEKVLAWTLTILLHILIIGGGIFWYFKQNPSSTPLTTTPIQHPATPETVADSSPASTIATPLQAEIDPTTVPTSPPSNQTPTPANPASLTNLANNKKPASSLTSNKAQALQNNPPSKTDAVPPAVASPETPIHTETNSKNKTPDNFPVNASTTIQTSSQTTQTTRGTVTITTTNRTTTIAPEVNQVLTDSDIPAKERQKLSQTTGKLSTNAKVAKKLATDLEDTNQATSKLIETVKKSNQQKIDNAQY